MPVNEYTALSEALAPLSPMPNARKRTTANGITVDTPNPGLYPAPPSPVFISVDGSQPMAQADGRMQSYANGVIVDTPVPAPMGYMGNPAPAVPADTRQHSRKALDDFMAEMVKKYGGQ